MRRHTVADAHSRMFVADDERRLRLRQIPVATGRSDHLGGDLTPDKFASRGNATHDDILFSPSKTPEINVPEVRMHRDGTEVVLINDYEPAEYMLQLLAE